MNARLLPLLAALVIAPVASHAQTASLTPEAIAAAISHGTKERGKEQGLPMIDGFAAFNSALAATNNSEANSGFRLIIYTPTTWLRQRASAAAKRYESLTAEQVTDDILEPVLRVVVDPNTPSHVSRDGLLGTSSVDHVVLQDKSRKVTIQPSSTDPFPVDVQNAFGAKVSYNGLVAKFPISDLREIRGAKGDAEFFIVVIGSNGKEKRFEIKRKHFDDLP